MERNGSSKREATRDCDDDDDNDGDDNNNPNNTNHGENEADANIAMDKLPSIDCDFCLPVEPEPFGNDNNSKNNSIPRGIAAVASGNSAAGQQADDAAALKNGNLTGEQAKQKNRIGRELIAWKKKFEEDHGRQPTAADINKERRIAMLYHEYSKLRKIKYGQN